MSSFEEDDIDMGPSRADSRYGHYRTREEILVFHFVSDNYKDGESVCLDKIRSRPRSMKQSCRALVLSPFERDFKHNLISPADR